MKFRLVFLTVLIAIMLRPAGPASYAAEQAVSDISFDYNLIGLAFVESKSPSLSSQNPDNSFLRMHRYKSAVHVRPDFFIETPYAGGVFKPRLISEYMRWEDGVMHGEADSLYKAYVNEWRIQIRLYPEISASFGKEKLLWGASFLTSPSNIFFKDTEKAEPKTEVEGKYLARFVYMPNDVITFSLISETQDSDNILGEQEEPLRALKADIQGGNYQVSVIGYHRERDRPRIGSYGQWTASDAAVLYFDGIVMKGTDALYPERDEKHPFGGELKKKYEDSDRLFVTATAGGSYTFLSGASMSVEFLYNGQGYGNEEADDYYDIRRRAAGHYFERGMLSALSGKILFDSLYTGSPFLCNYYLLTQYQHREIMNAINIILRYVHGIDEGSGMLTTMIEWQASDRIQIFNINNLSADRGGETEHNSITRSSFLAGIEAHF